MTQETSHTPALLFDLDGTLIDSVYQHVLAWHEALEEMGLSLAVWRIHRRIGMSGGLLVQALGREIGQRLNLRTGAKTSKATCGRVRAVSGSDSAASGRSRTLATTEQSRRSLCNRNQRASRRSPLERSERLAIGPEIPVITRQEVQRAKPDPDLFLAAAQNDSMSLSQEPWLSATVCGTCWRLEEPVV